MLDLLPKDIPARIASKIGNQLIKFLMLLHYTCKISFGVVEILDLILERLEPDISAIHSCVNESFILLSAPDANEKTKTSLEMLQMFLEYSPRSFFFAIDPLRNPVNEPDAWIQNFRFAISSPVAEVRKFSVEFLESHLALAPVPEEESLSLAAAVAAAYAFSEDVLDRLLEFFPHALKAQNQKGQNLLEIAQAAQNQATISYLSQLL